MHHNLLTILPLTSPAARLQVVLGFVRPAPKGNLRPAWNVVHHNLGRLSILSAWVTIYLGIVIGHASPTYNLDYAAWLCPTAIVMGLMVIADVVLTVMRARREEALQEDEAAQSLSDMEHAAAETDAAAGAQKFVEVYGRGRGAGGAGAIGAPGVYGQDSGSSSGGGGGGGHGDRDSGPSNGNSQVDGMAEVEAVRANVRAG